MGVPSQGHKRAGAGSQAGAGGRAAPHAGHARAGPRGGGGGRDAQQRGRGRAAPGAASVPSDPAAAAELYRRVMRPLQVPACALPGYWVAHEAWWRGHFVITKRGLSGLSYSSMAACVVHGHLVGVCA